MYQVDDNLARFWITIGCEKALADQVVKYTVKSLIRIRFGLQGILRLLTTCVAMLVPKLDEAYKDAASNITLLCTD